VAGRRKDVLDVRELIRRVRLGDGVRRVARDMRVSRKTVAKYVSWATGQGLLSGELVEAGEFKRRLDASLPTAPPPRGAFKVERYREQIQALRAKGVESRAIYDRLREAGEFTASYSAVWRFVRSLEPVTPEGFVRVETPPGDEAQVDFGFAGIMYDPAKGIPRRAWAFVMTLSYSRHQCVELVFDQEVDTWLRCHRNAFEWFGGVPKRVVLDNLKAAIIRHALHDPVVQRAYREFAGTLRVPDLAVPAPHPQTQGQGGEGRGALRQEELPGGTRLHRHPRGEPQGTGVVRGDGRQAGPRHHQAAAPQEVRRGGARRVAGVAGSALRTGDVEEGEAARGLPRGV
jgi:transposase